MTKIWDLKGVSPLFRIPSSVLFAHKEKENIKRNLPTSGIDGVSYEGVLPLHNCKYYVAKDLLKETSSKWYFAKQGKSSAFSTSKHKVQTLVNPYKDEFRQGATIVPRSFYFVELTQELPPDYDERIINIKTADAIKHDAKPPWKSLELSGRIESKFLFRTALSKSILPFALFKPDLAVLPITIELDESNQKKILLHSADDLMGDGYLHASRWFKNAENFWKIYRTENNKNMSSENYLNWQNKLVNQNLNAPYLVLYNSSAINANATIVIRKEINLEFIVESKGYAFETDNLHEGYYLVSILNSAIPNALMKDFQSRGLWGARDVHKKILDIYFPKYNEEDETHKRLADISKAAHQKGALYLATNPPKEELTATRLGRLRVEIKKHLSPDMKEIDKIVKKLIDN